MSDLARSPGIQQKYDSLGYQYEATFAHSAVHRDVIIQASDYAAGVTTRYYLIKVPAGVFPHLIFDVSCNEQGRVDFFEGATVSAEGEAITIARLNRNSVKVTNTAISHSPTVTDEGALLTTAFIPGANGSGSPGGQVAIHNDAEWLLKEDTNYLVKIEASNSIVNIKFEWYE